MKYARINVKCNYELIKEINSILPSYTGRIYIKDFFTELVANANKVMNYAERKNDEDKEIGTEFYIMCPLSVYKEARSIMCKVPKDYSELYLLLEHIAKLDENSFIA